MTLREPVQGPVNVAVRRPRQSTRPCSGDRLARGRAPPSCSRGCPGRRDDGQTRSGGYEQTSSPLLAIRASLPATAFVSEHQAMRQMCTTSMATSRTSQTARLPSRTRTGMRDLRSAAASTFRKVKTRRHARSRRRARRVSAARVSCHSPRTRSKSSHGSSGSSGLGGSGSSGRRRDHHCRPAGSVRATSAAPSTPRRPPRPDAPGAQ